MIPSGILLPVKRKYTKLIIDGQKLAEARKNNPKIELPCPVYIYESFGTQRYVTDELWGDKYDEWFGYEIFKEVNPYKHLRLITEGRGSIVARFTLESVEIIKPDWEDGSYEVDSDLLNDLKLNIQELIKYVPQSFIYLTKEKVDEIERLNNIPF